MSLSAAALKIMADKGLSAHDIAEIAAANEKPGDTAADRRRAWDRERKREQREATRLSGGKSGGNPPDPAPNEIDILTPTQTPHGISDEIPPPADEIEIELKPEHVVEVWNDLATRHGLPAVKKITPERRKKLNTFIRRHSIDDITEAIAAIPRSPFLLGQNGRGWQATFDWFLEPRNVTKLTEGTYAH